MNLYTAVSYLKSNLTELGCQLDDINQTNNNANLANTAGGIVNAAFGAVGTLLQLWREVRSGGREGHREGRYD